ncbi:helix-turn-helix domain-containing protein [Bacillus sp. JCM 19034]|uniref:helix-turn-helix domain-containing protein n=1 Tax=Bacillus sp. JCM 19034 TaxID=1481928 RepID=UPI000780ADC1|nr:helix-turn-helix domain-containing protein [Bacillus sp. JCM 19034]
MKHLSSYQDIHYIGRLIYQTLKIPVSYINNSDNTIISYPQFVVINPIYATRSELFKSLSFHGDPSYQPVYKSTPYFEQFISLKVGKKHEGIWLLGPTLEYELSEHNIQGLIHDLHLKVKYQTLDYYYHSLEIVKKSKLIQLGMLVTYMITSEKVKLEDIIGHNIDESETIIKENPDILVSKSRQENSFHNTYSWEKALLQSIKDGQKEELTKWLNRPDGRAGVLSKKSHLRNVKNLSISVITLATRASIEGGVHPETAYTMSDLFIQELEELQHSKDAFKLMNKALYTFTEKVSETKRRQYSPPILKCQSYIYQHLYEKITLLKLAELVNMHENYLSTLFKREVGISISEYIIREKIEESKRLLIYTNTTISEIYTWLNFHDQSHFTKVFKKFVGVTPRKYRQSQRL